MHSPPSPLILRYRGENLEPCTCWANSLPLICIWSPWRFLFVSIPLTFLDSLWISHHISWCHLSAFPLASTFCPCKFPHKIKQSLKEKPKIKQIKQNNNIINKKEELCCRSYSMACGVTTYLLVFSFSFVSVYCCALLDWIKVSGFCYTIAIGLLLGFTINILLYCVLEILQFESLSSFPSHALTLHRWSECWVG